MLKNSVGGLGLIEPAQTPSRGTVGDASADGTAATEGQGPSLRVFIALFCTVLRQAVKIGWLDREVVEGTRAVARLAEELHAAAGGFTLRILPNQFRHDESGQRLVVSSKAVVQLHRFCQRRGFGAIRFAADVTPLAVKNLARGLLDPACDLDAGLPPGCGVEKVDAHADTPDVLILRDDGAEERAFDEADANASSRRVADPLAPHGAAAGGGASGGAPQRSAVGAGLGAGAGPVGSQAYEQGAGTMAPPAFPRATGELEREVQLLRRENATIRDAMTAFVSDAKPASQPAILTSIEAMERDEHLAYMLISLRQHDRYTFDHSCNVALLAVAIARAVGVTGDELRRFATAALLHDIGKLYTPLEVLNKPGRFTPDEWKAMKRHPVDGMEILEGAGFENSYSRRVTLLHHVGFDGSGYPACTKEQPDLYAQIVQVADVYDAFTTIRPYRQQARPREVLEVLREGAGTQFNPAVVDATVRLMGDTPIGSVLKLSNGQLALVVDSGGTGAGRPIVRVIQDETGRRPAGTTLLDLSARVSATGEYKLDVIEAVDPLIRNISIGRYV